MGFPSPIPFPNLALAPGALELAGVYLKVSFKDEFSSATRGISFSLCLCLAFPAEVSAAAPL